MKLKKKDGDIGASIFVILTLFLVYILWSFICSKGILMAEGQICHDGLVSSNLAALSTKNINQDLLGQDPDKKLILVKDPEAAYSTFQVHLKYNLGLDNNYEPNRKKFILSKVDIKSFVIYNVNTSNGDVIEYDLNTSTGLFTSVDHPNSAGKLKTDNGNVIKETTVHSVVGFYIQTMFGHKEYINISEDTGALEE